MYGSHPPSRKGKHPKGNPNYRLLLSFQPRWQTNLNLDYDKDYTRYGVTRYGVVWYMFIRPFLLHRTVTTQGYSSPNDNLGPCTTTMYPQDRTNHHDSI
jgi:hypothetical protein